jgi:transcriptional antiterminator RfaH
MPACSLVANPAMNGPSQTPAGLEWFCVRTQPKHEHIAAASLRQQLQLEVFLPRIRFKRLTRQGPAWTTEALFVNYLFARFDLTGVLRRVKHARGVQDVVHFGGHWPVIPEMVITDLRSSMGEDELQVITNDFNPGETVEIAGGAFHGLQAVVTRVLPARQRVAVLLDFLGRQTSVEMDTAKLIRKDQRRSLS